MVAFVICGFYVCCGVAWYSKAGSRSRHLFMVEMVISVIQWVCCLFVYSFFSKDD